VAGFGNVRFFREPRREASDEHFLARTPRGRGNPPTSTIAVSNVDRAKPSMPSQAMTCDPRCRRSHATRPSLDPDTVFIQRGGGLRISRTAKSNCALGRRPSLLEGDDTHSLIGQKSTMASFLPQEPKCNPCSIKKLKAHRLHSGQGRRDSIMEECHHVERSECRTAISRVN
jgi:hypothetical protein